MNRKCRLLALIFLNLIAVFVTATPALAQVIPANPTPTPIAQNTSNDADDDELKTQEEILAELKKLRSEKEGWKTERIGLNGQITVLTTQLQLMTEQKDFFKNATNAGIKIDQNQQTIASNDKAVILDLQRRIEDKNEKIADLTADLNSCKAGQKWAFVGGAVGGGFAGWFLRGTVNNFTNGLNRDINNSFSNRFTAPVPDFRALPNTTPLLDNRIPFVFKKKEQ